ncbi:MAG: serine hydrolase family protein [Rhodoferax sp.]|nr:serine hydrolase family protein [Rhodoferax sp.]
MSDAKVLLLPGWQNSGPAHWQSRWERKHGYVRVQQHDWMQPLRGDWIARLQDVVLDHVAQKAPDAPADIVLVAHSLGCQLVAAWAASSALSIHVRGALLVAPGDPQREALAGVLGSWWRIARQTLPFPSLLLGSRDDPYCSFERAQEFAQAWGAQFIDCGNCGHINAESGLGDWPQGHALLAQLADAPATPFKQPQQEG